MTDNTPPIFTFEVSVDISVSPATYSYTESGEPSNGSVSVTVPNTKIVYQLVTEGLTFTDPLITDDPDGDLTYEISNGNRTLTITDSDADKEAICLKLVVQDSAGTTYTSPDPSIDNKPPQ
jgi:hypothetical protein